MPTACHSIFILSHLLQDRDIFWSSHCTSHCSAMYTFINEVWHGMWICIPTQAWWGSPCVLNTYHPLTLIQVSRVWSHLIASMTSTARQCWTTPDHLFAEPCAQDPREGHGAAAPCVQGDRTCCMWNVESSAARPTDTVHPRLWDSGAQELLAREDLSRVSAWTAPLGSHASMSLTAHEKAVGTFSHYQVFCWH